MTRFILLALISSLIIKCDAGPTTLAPKNSIYQEIAKDPAICKNIFLDSRYTKNCTGVGFPTANASLNDATQYLCLALYDRIFRLCYLSSRAKNPQILLPSSADVFDARVDKSKKTDIMYFCSEWKKPPGPRYSRVETWVEQFETLMKGSATCTKVCTDWYGQKVDLCWVVATMDDIGAKMMANDTSLSKETEKSPPESSKPVKKVETITTAHDSTRKLENFAVSVGKTVNKSIATETKAKESPGAIPPRSPQKISGKVSPKVENALSQEQKTSVVPTPTVVEASAKDGDLKESERPKVSADARETRIDAPSTKNDEVNLQDVNTETEKIPLLEENPNEPENNVISEHTQDEEKGIAELPEDGNELESPPSSNEDLNEAPPAQTSEKLEFVPRMPGVLRDDDDSHFFGYLTVISVICIAGYFGYHNKQKIFAMVLEGRRGSSRGGRGGRRRPSTANYRKLDCTLEEAVTSQCNSNVTHVIY